MRRGEDDFDFRNPGTSDEPNWRTRLAQIGGFGYCNPVTRWQRDE